MLQVLEQQYIDAQPAVLEALRQAGIFAAQAKEGEQAAGIEMMYIQVCMHTLYALVMFIRFVVRGSVTVTLICTNK